MQAMTAAAALEKHMAAMLPEKIRLDDDGDLLDEERRRIVGDTLSWMAAEGYAIRGGWSLEVRLIRDRGYALHVLAIDPFGERHNAGAPEAWEPVP